MKKVLGLMSLMVLGLGLVVWAAAPLSGDVSLTLTLDPSATTFATYIDLDAGLGLAYAIGGWTFTSTSGFSSDGWDAQSFAAEGLLGAFSFSATANFLPYALVSTATTTSYANGTLYFDNGIEPWSGVAVPNLLPVALVASATIPIVEVTTTTSAYGVAFDDLTVTGGVSIAGVSFAAEFFMEYWAGASSTTTEPVYFYEVTIATPPGPVAPTVWLTDNGPATDQYMVQSGSDTVTTAGSTVTGAGWLFTVGGSFGDVTLTSYTFFNLDPTAMVKLDISSSFSISLVAYTIDQPDQVVRFSHEVLVLDGLSLGCIEAEAYLWISCDHGFEHLLLLFENIPVICCGITTDFAIDFSLQNKYVQLYPSIAGDWLCWTPTLSLDWDGTSVIDGISLDAIEVEVALNGITFSSKTTFGSFLGTIDSGNTTDYYFTIPKIDTATTTIPIPCVLANSIGYYVIDKVEIANDYYKTFEYFKIEVDGDSCCGGAFDVTVQTWFGQHYTADLGEYGYWYETNAAGGVGTIAATYGQGFYFVNGATPITYMYDSATSFWFPQCGVIPVNVIDVAYGALIGLDGVPVVYTVSAPPVAADIVETVTGAYTTVETATAGMLFEWAKTAIDASVGIGANFSLTFALAIDAYGWDSLGFGFEYTF